MARQPYTKGAKANRDIELQSGIDLVEQLTKGLAPEQRMTPMQYGPQPEPRQSIGTPTPIEMPSIDVSAEGKEKSKKIEKDDTPELLAALRAVQGEPSEQAIPTAQPLEIASSASTEPTREPSSMSMSDTDALLVGATPLLAGLLAGNMEDAYSASSQGMMTLAKWRMEKEKKKEAQLNVEKVVGPDGKPMFVDRRQAIGMQPYEKGAEGSDFHLAEKMKLEAFKAGLKTEDPKERQQLETALRKELKDLNTTKNTRLLSESFTKLQREYNSMQTGAGDMKMIFQYMKILDPNSVVKEGEYATAAKAGTIPENIITQYNRLIGGDVKLNPEVRRKFYQAAKRAYQSQLGVQSNYDRQYRDLAKGYGVDPEKVVLKSGVKFLDKPPRTQGGHLYVWDYKKSEYKDMGPLNEEE